MPFDESIRAVRTILGAHRNWSPQTAVDCLSTSGRGHSKTQGSTAHRFAHCWRSVRGQAADRAAHNPSSPSRREPPEIGTGVLGYPHGNARPGSGRRYRSGHRAPRAGSRTAPTVPPRREYRASDRGRCGSVGGSSNSSSSDSARCRLVWPRCGWSWAICGPIPNSATFVRGAIRLDGRLLPWSGRRPDSSDDRV